MVVDRNAPYSLDLVIKLNTLIRLRWAPVDKVITLRGAPYHEAPHAEQIAYWGAFLSMAAERLDNEG